MQAGCEHQRANWGDVGRKVEVVTYHLTSEGHAARRKIKAGEELSYNYGYDFDICKDHPCRCGSPKCIGYILAREQWYKIRRERDKKAAERAKKRKKLPTLLS